MSELNPKIDTIIAETERNFNDDVSGAARLFHGRGQCFQGLEHVSIDLFVDILLITLFKEENKGFLDALKESLLSSHDGRVKAVVLQKRYLPIAESTLIYGGFDDAYAIEKGLRFKLDLKERQNIGFFLDMATSRQWLSENSQGKNILNLFAFTCAFSVVAAAHGAKSVVNLDMGRGVLERGRLNHKLNLDQGSSNDCQVTFIKSNVFKAWNKLHKYGRYDLIVIDPPSFQKGSFDIEKDYAKVVKRLTKLLQPNARVLACLNSPFIEKSFLDALFVEGEVEGFSKEREISPPSSFREIDPNKGLKVVVYHYQRPD